MHVVCCAQIVDVAVHSLTVPTPEPQQPWPSPPHGALVPPHEPSLQSPAPLPHDVPFCTHVPLKQQPPPSQRFQSQHGWPAPPHV